MTLRVALLQATGAPGDIDANLAAVDRAAGSAVARGARLLICPELFLSGYHIGDRATALAEPLDGPALTALAGIARRRAIAVLTGYPERAGDRVYNAACLVERDGSLLANYRKTHLYGPEERRVYRAGDGFVQAQIDGYRIGLLICYDVEFPEAVRAQALAGCDLVAVPTALMWPQDFAATLLVPARAVENGCFVAYVNRCGEERGLRYVGLSCVIAPDGGELARAGREPALLLADLDRERYREWRDLIPYLRDRRPPLYRALQSDDD